MDVQAVWYRSEDGQIDDGCPVLESLSVNGLALRATISSTVMLQPKSWDHATVLVCILHQKSVLELSCKQMSSIWKGSLCNQTK